MSEKLPYTDANLGKAYKALNHMGGDFNQEDSDQYDYNGEFYGMHIISDEPTGAEVLDKELDTVFEMMVQMQVRLNLLNYKHSLEDEAILKECNALTKEILETQIVTSAMIVNLSVYTGELDAALLKMKTDEDMTNTVAQKEVAAYREVSGKNPMTELSEAALEIYMAQERELMFKAQADTFAQHLIPLLLQQSGQNVEYAQLHDEVVAMIEALKINNKITFAGFMRSNPEILLKDYKDALNTLVVPGMPLDIHVLAKNAVNNFLVKQITA